MDPTYTKAEILAAFKTWYKDTEGYSDENAEEHVNWLVQTMEDARSQPEPV